MLLSTNFTAKCHLVFVLTKESTSFKRFYFTTNRKTLGSSKNYIKNFTMTMTITGDFERFQYFNFEASFLKKENFSRKTGVPLFG